MFSMQSVSLNPLIATFQLSCAASLSLGQSQNDVLGKGLTKCQKFRLVQIQSFSRLQNKCDLQLEICFWKDRKHCGKRRKC